MAKHSARGRDWDAQRLRVLTRDGWVCQYCGADLSGAGLDAQVDHVDPLSTSGGREYGDDELVAACGPCNRRKSDQPLQRMEWRHSAWFTTA